jgi:predicted nucleic acid-binding Zn ribbon protein
MSMIYQRKEFPTSCIVCGADVSDLPRKRRPLKICGAACRRVRRIEQDAKRHKTLSVAVREQRNARERERDRERRRLASLAKERSCVVCGIDIRHTHFLQKTCSESCRHDWKLAQLRQRYRETPKEVLAAKRKREREWRRQYVPQWRKKNPDRCRAYSRNQKQNTKYRLAKTMRRRREWSAIGATIKAMREVGLLDGVPAKTSGDKRAILRAARDLGIA